MLACGVLGFFMRRYGLSPAALVIALVLGPMAEETLRQTLLISGGSFDIFVERNTSLVLFCVILLTAAVAAADPRRVSGHRWSRHRSEVGPVRRKRHAASGERACGRRQRSRRPSVRGRRVGLALAAAAGGGRPAAPGSRPCSGSPPRHCWARWPVWRWSLRDMSVAIPSAGRWLVYCLVGWLLGQTSRGTRWGAAQQRRTGRGHRGRVPGLRPRARLVPVAVHLDLDYRAPVDRAWRDRADGRALGRPRPTCPWCWRSMCCG